MSAGPKERPLSPNSALDTEEKTEGLLRRLCVEHLGEVWEEMETRVISGGITNALYLCTRHNVETVPATQDMPRRVIVRLFGADTDMYIDRSTEAVINSALCAAGLGKRTFATFEGGRIEEWLDGRSITTERMSEQPIYTAVATTVARLHSLEVPISKEPTVFTSIHKWLEACMAVTLDSDEQKARLGRLHIPALRSQIERLEASLQSSSPVVFCHNDLLSGNIVWNGSSIELIDFEYSSYNYRGFDLANHFCEWCGFECDWSKYPTAEQQLLFCAAYRDEDPVSLVAEAQVWAPVPHLFWGLWSVLQASQSPLDFDFLLYAEKRLAAFHASI